MGENRAMNDTEKKFYPWSLCGLNSIFNPYRL